MNKEALLRVAELVDKPECIDLSMWAWRTRYVDDFPDIMKTCGYIACAIGHAMFDSWHNERGFKATIEGFRPIFADAISWEAVKLFYSIPHGDAIRLFSESSYVASTVTGAAVAERIREYVQKYEQTENESV